MGSPDAFEKEAFYNGDTIETGREASGMSGKTEQSGLMFHIQRYSIHDGPGIRTLVFMKGCPLKCLWCSNPEGIYSGLDILSQPSKCIGCGACREVCPHGAIGPRPCPRGRPRCMGCGSCSPMPGLGDEYTIDRVLCDHCGRCVAVCPSNAKSAFGEWVTVEEIMEKIRRDAVFYKNSGGGVTMGGGEILMQPAFVCEVLRRCSAEGIDTAIETCGQGDWEWLDKIADFCNTVHYDVKAIDPWKHNRLTGHGNERILENLVRLDRKLAPLPETALIVRMPLVAGYNDDDEDIRRAGEFICQNLTSYRKVELMPFHNMGEQKYKQLGMDYLFAGKPNAPRGAFDSCAEILRAMGIPTDISVW